MRLIEKVEDRKKQCEENAKNIFFTSSDSSSNNYSLFSSREKEQNLLSSNEKQPITVVQSQHFFLPPLSNSLNDQLNHHGINFENYQNGSDNNYHQIDASTPSSFSMNDMSV